MSRMDTLLSVEAMMIVFAEDEGPNSLLRSTSIVRMFPSTVISTFFMRFSLRSASTGYFGHTTLIMPRASSAGKNHGTSVRPRRLRSSMIENGAQARTRIRPWTQPGPGRAGAVAVRPPSTSSSQQPSFLGSPSPPMG